VPSSRPEIRFLDILDNIRLIQSYVEGRDRVAFDADSRTREAVERCLERLSEAATNLDLRPMNWPQAGHWRPFGLSGTSCVTPMTRSAISNPG
jgi:uncharacterized protein with HEPN domain